MFSDPTSLDSRYQDENARITYLTIHAVDGFGNSTEMLLGNGVTLTRTHDAATGRTLHPGISAAGANDCQVR